MEAPYQKKTNPEEEAQSQSVVENEPYRVKVGDIIELPNGSYTVEAMNHGRWWVCDELSDPSPYQFTIPPGYVLYYIETSSSFLKLDVRQGDVEVRYFE